MVCFEWVASFEIFGYRYRPLSCAFMIVRAFPSGTAVDSLSSVCNDAAHPSIQLSRTYRCAGLFRPLCIWKELRMSVEMLEHVKALDPRCSRMLSPRTNASRRS
jgi:hypothetical protein